MKLILWTIFYFSIAYASDDKWDECDESITRSPTGYGQFFRPETPEEQTVPHYTVHIATEKKIEDTDNNDKPHKTNLTIFSQYPFLKSYKFVIPCATIITYIAYRWLK